MRHYHAKLSHFVPLVPFCPILSQAWDKLGQRNTLCNNTLTRFVPFCPILSQAWDKLGQRKQLCHNTLTRFVPFCPRIRRPVGQAYSLLRFDVSASSAEYGLTTGGVCSKGLSTKELGRAALFARVDWSKATNSS